MLCSAMLTRNCVSKIRVIFLIASIVLIEVVNSQSPCSTQSLVSGVCVPVLTCETITQLLISSPKPLPASTIEFIRQSHCGTIDSVHHVCCEPNRVNAGTLMNTRANITIKSVAKSDDDVQYGMTVLEASECGRGTPRVSFIAVGNGGNADLSEFPWLALLIYEVGAERTMDCGGSLITDRYVLTAAHCIRAGRRKLIGVRLGEHDVNTTNDCSFDKCAPPIQEIGIEEAIYHNDYSPSEFADDIGLIRLISKATFRSNVQPICLPLTGQPLANPYRSMMIAGWGRLETGVKANILQKAEVPLRTNAYCQSIHTVIQITDKHLCAGGEKLVDTCKGDSGGPIFFFSRELRYTQYGVISAGSFQCGSRFPSIFVRVTSYLSWIAGNLRP